MARKAKAFDKLTKIEMANIRQAKRVYADRIKLYNEGCNLLSDVIDEICLHIVKGNMQDVVLIALSNRVLGTSKVLYELSIRGYKFDSNVVVRGLYETSIIMEYVDMSLDNANKWFKGKVQLKDVRKVVSVSCDEILKNFYNSLSDYVHCNFAAIYSLIKIPEGNYLDLFSEPDGLADSNHFLPSFWAVPIKILSSHYKSYISSSNLEKINEMVTLVLSANNEKQADAKT